ncbi:hypothetical protein [Pedosphaera parvula]|uniref:Uncharacterized protein n=1 Tax=Pedosphaera parvula (strain Ellin514) TaxID=320771 RepID=B9XSS0_PEDPL|nr:hypothetical protein [Pedosphaera parvula]EEF57122.1 hypothetical protein Cflav_PD0162 [Pedosphaera parvula Ellin514]
MYKKEQLKGLYFARTFLNGCLLAGVLCISLPAKASDTVTPAKPIVSTAAPLDGKRFYALGMIETGNNDYLVGSIGEVSRYQIHPQVWKNYSSSTEYVNPAVARRVVRQHWDYLAKYFKEKTGREPQDFDMYVMWNTRFGYYAKKGFDVSKLNPVVKERAERFVNLVNKRDIPARELIAAN